jgi:hypothetical protein
MFDPILALLACVFVGACAWMLRRSGALEQSPASAASGTRPLTEGYVVKGGQNAFPSQIKDRPPAPGAIDRSSRARSALTCNHDGVNAENLADAP